MCTALLNKNTQQRSNKSEQAFSSISFESSTEREEDDSCQLMTHEKEKQNKHLGLDRPGNRLHRPPECSCTSFHHR
eukprot:m.216080 g.216080  ORF g.216080 m.216080 type:complete len:76 (+) comp22211_c12_seq2:1244-1471(+)